MVQELNPPELVSGSAAGLFRKHNSDARRWFHVWFRSSFRQSSSDIKKWNHRQNEVEVGTYQLLRCRSRCRAAVGINNQRINCSLCWLWIITTNISQIGVCYFLSHQNGGYRRDEFNGHFSVVSMAEIVSHGDMMAENAGKVKSTTRASVRQRLDIENSSDCTPR